MEPYYAGILSLLPPVIAITLALITKEVISSLLVGILTGTLIYSLNTGLNPIVGTVDITFKLMTQRMDVSILLFLALLGALVVVVSMAGGSRAYGRWASEKLRSKRSAQLATSALGALIFIDDYFNCLTVGTVMKPVTDKYGVSRAKLAYIIDREGDANGARRQPDYLAQLIAETVRGNRLSRCLYDIMELREQGTKKDSPCPKTQGRPSYHPYCTTAALQMQ